MREVSDLFCPARILLCRVGGTDRGEVDRLGVRLSRERVAAVYSSGAPGAAEGGAALALRLGLTAEVAVDLSTAPYAALAGIADRHRGESVVVVGDDVLAGPPGLGVPPATRVPAGVPPEPAVTVVEIDADGWRVAPL